MTYYDPVTGKLSLYNVHRARDYLDMSKSGEGFFGGVLNSTLAESSERDHTATEFEEAVMAPVQPKEANQFYKVQSLQVLGMERDRVLIPVWISCGRGGSKYKTVAPSWIPHIQKAIHEINHAAPGLNVHITSFQSAARIKIAGNDENSCYTTGTILRASGAEIKLSQEWGDMKRTSCHEILHAIGFGHEHQRRDRNLSVFVQNSGPQYRVRNELVGVTRFDPFSIMLYPEDEELARRSGDPVWFTKPFKQPNREMSELDKVALNNLYHPCYHSQYSPTAISSVTGLWYCGRYFGVQCPDHNGYCGPTNGPNCPACRVLRSERVKELWRKGKWQGWTGEVYCGRYFGVKSPGHDGCCGPNNGPSCPECEKELLSWVMNLR